MKRLNQRHFDKWRTIYYLSYYSQVPGSRIRPLAFFVHLFFFSPLVSVFVLYIEYSLNSKIVDWNNSRTALVIKGWELWKLNLFLTVSYISFVLSCYTQSLCTCWDIFKQHCHFCSLPVSWSDRQRDICFSSNCPYFGTNAQPWKFTRRMRPLLQI